MQKGRNVEEAIIKSYDNKIFKQLNEFQKEIIKELFGDVTNYDVIEAGSLSEMYKPDIYLKIEDKIKYISIKSGRSDSIHFEGIKSFILFLRSKGISLRTQKIILLFHYGDGTIDGTGEKRYEFNKIIEKMGDLLDEANEELDNKELITDLMYRFVFRGFRDDEPCVDMLYFGDENYGEYATRDNIIKYVVNKRYIHIKTLHVGPMTVQPYLRDVLRKSKHPEKREQIQVKWHYLLTDIQYVNNKIKKQK